MSETINKGWIKSPDEIKFAPKTFAEQVIVNGETTLDMELEKYETIKNNCPTLDAEDTEGTCTAGDYVSRIQELEAKNLELTNELAELNSKIEVGTWTPQGVKNFILTGGYGQYCKIGNLVFISGYISGHAESESGGQSSIGTLPFTPSSDAVIHVGLSTLKMVNASWYKYDFQLLKGYKTFFPVYWVSGRSWGSDNCFSTEDGTLYFSGTYITNE